MDGYQGTLRSTIVTAPRTSGQLSIPGATVSAHVLNELRGDSQVKATRQELHFSWASGFVGGTAYSGGVTREYGNRPRYCFLAPRDAT